jgi:hypothetical protein
MDRGRRVAGPTADPGREKSGTPYRVNGHMTIAPEGIVARFADCQPLLTALADE